MFGEEIMNEWIKQIIGLDKTQENLYIFFNMLVEKFFFLASSENSVMLNTEFIMRQIKNKQDQKWNPVFIYYPISLFQWQ